MSIDDRLTTGLAFERTSERLEVERLLRNIEHKATRRRRLRIGATLVAAACVLALLALVLSPEDDGRRSVPPVGPSVDDSSAPVVSSDACTSSVFSCVDDVPQSMTMGVPVRWDSSLKLDPAPDFTANATWDEVLIVELHRSNTKPDVYAGIDIVQRVRAPSLTRTGKVDRSVQADAESMARWLAQRRDLQASAVSTETIDGRPAWSVTVRPTTPDKKATVDCNDRFRCTPILHVDGAGKQSTQGLFEGLLSRFTFLDVPNAGVVVIWSWALPDNPRLLAGNQALIDSIQFG